MGSTHQRPWKQARMGAARERLWEQVVGGAHPTGFSMCRRVPELGGDFQWVGHWPASGQWHPAGRLKWYLGIGSPEAHFHESPEL